MLESLGIKIDVERTSSLYRVHPIMRDIPLLHNPFRLLKPARLRD